MSGLYYYYYHHVVCVRQGLLTWENGETPTPAPQAPRPPCTLAPLHPCTRQAADQQIEYTKFREPRKRKACACGVSQGGDHPTKIGGSGREDRRSRRESKRRKEKKQVSTNQPATDTKIVSNVSREFLGIVLPRRGSGVNHFIAGDEGCLPTEENAPPPPTINQCQHAAWPQPLPMTG